MSLGAPMPWLITGAVVALIVCSVMALLRPQLPPMLRFGPIAALLAYTAAAVLQVFVAGLAPVLVAMIASFGLWLAVRYVPLRSMFGYFISAVSFLFWGGALFVSVQYLVRAHQ